MLALVTSQHSYGVLVGNHHHEGLVRTGSLSYMAYVRARVVDILRSKQKFFAFVAILRHKLSGENLLKLAQYSRFKCSGMGSYCFGVRQSHIVQQPEYN